MLDVKRKLLDAISEMYRQIDDTYLGRFTFLSKEDMDSFLTEFKDYRDTMYKLILESLETLKLSKW